MEEYIHSSIPQTWMKNSNVIRALWFLERQPIKAKKTGLITMTQTAKDQENKYFIMTSYNHGQNDMLVNHF